MLTIKKKHSISLILAVIVLLLTLIIGAFIFPEAVFTVVGSVIISASIVRVIHYFIEGY